MSLTEGSFSGKRILDFYSERALDNRGRGLSEILAWDDARLETVHDYIQWLFPLPEASGANPNAPVLDAQAMAEFRADQALQRQLHRAFLRMLAFYGLRLGPGGVERADDFGGKSYGWLQPGNHNHLRLTRILRSLYALGLEQDARLLFACLSSIYEAEEATAHPRITAHTFSFWMAAVEK